MDRKLRYRRQDGENAAKTRRIHGVPVRKRVKDIHGELPPNERSESVDFTRIPSGHARADCYRDVSSH